MSLSVRFGLMTQKQITTGNQSRHFATFEVWGNQVNKAWLEVRRTEDPNRLRGDPLLTRFGFIDKPHPDAGRPFITFDSVWCETGEPLAGEALYDELARLFRDGDTRWTRTTEREANRMLSAVPPHRRRDRSFLVGEVWDHTPKGEEVYHCFLEFNGRHFARNMTEATYNQELASGRSPEEMAKRFSSI
jgi:hypothetical protein